MANKIVIIEQGELKRLISEAVQAALSAALPKTEEKEYLTRKEAAEYLDCSISTIDNLARDGKIKRYRVGGGVRFLKSELIK